MPCVRRNWSTTSATTTRARTGAVPVLGHHGGRSDTVECRHAATADRHAGLRCAETGLAGGQPGLSGRRIGFHALAGQTGAAEVRLKLLTRQLDRRVTACRSSCMPAPPASCCEPTPGDRQARSRRRWTARPPVARPMARAGIRLAYAVARQAFIKDGINRVMLATDGDFNVGTTISKR